MERFHASKDSALDLPKGDKETVRSGLQHDRDEQAALLRAQRRERDQLRQAARQSEEESRKMYGKVLDVIYGNQHPKSSKSLKTHSEDLERRANSAQQRAKTLQGDWNNYAEKRKVRENIQDGLAFLRENILNSKEKIESKVLETTAVEDVLPEELFVDIARGLLSEYQFNSHSKSVPEDVWEMVQGLTKTVERTGGMDVNFQYLKDYYSAQFQKILQHIAEKPAQVPNMDDRILEGMVRISYHNVYQFTEAQKDLIQNIFDQLSPRQQKDFVRTRPSLVDTCIRMGVAKAKELTKEEVVRAFEDGPEAFRDFEMLRVAGLYAMSRVVMEVLASRVAETYRLEEGGSVVTAWLSAGNYDKTKISENLLIMQGLEKRREGSVRLLCEFYGIKEFHRYPPAMLAEQVEKHNEDVPYGVVIYPRGDHNNAFDNVKIFEQLQESTQGRHTTRIFEAGNKKELLRAIVKIRSRARKIDYLVVGAHGEPHGMHLGETPAEEQFLNKDDLLALDTSEAIKSLLAEDCSIVLNSCSTGTEGGFAQMLSEKLGISVQGPEIPTAAGSLEVQYNEQGRPKLRAEYDSRGNGNVKAEYQHGRLVEV